LPLTACHSKRSSWPDRVTAVATLARYVLFSPADIARPGFSAPDAALTWALSGFSNGTVWLIFAAFMFAFNVPAWNTLAWFATLVAHADGLNRVGFAKWLAELIGHRIVGLPAIAALLILLATFFLSHYMFASVTAHVTAL
jgi:di/tricarboxylate transporter